MENEELCFNPCSIGLAIEGDYRFVDRIIEISFNPCSIGLAIEGASKRIHVTQKPSFNPCSIGLAIEGDSTIFISCCFLSFQSLFYWISYRRTTQYGQHLMGGIVSILVLLD